MAGVMEWVGMLERERTEWCGGLVMGLSGVGWGGVVIEKGGRVLMVVEWCGGLRMRSVTPGDKKSGCRRAI